MKKYVFCFMAMLAASFATPFSVYADDRCLAVLQRDATIPGVGPGAGIDLPEGAAIKICPPNGEYIYQDTDGVLMYAVGFDPNDVARSEWGDEYVPSNTFWFKEVPATWYRYYLPSQSYQQAGTYNYDPCGDPNDANNSSMYDENEFYSYYSYMLDTCPDRFYF